MIKTKQELQIFKSNLKGLNFNAKFKLRFY